MKLSFNNIKFEKKINFIYFKYINKFSGPILELTCQGPAPRTDVSSIEVEAHLPTYAHGQVRASRMVLSGVVSSLDPSVVCVQVCSPASQYHKQQSIGLDSIQTESQNKLV